MSNVSQVFKIISNNWFADIGEIVDKLGLYLEGIKLKLAIPDRKEIGFRRGIKYNLIIYSYRKRRLIMLDTETQSNILETDIDARCYIGCGKLTMIGTQNR